MQAVVLGATHSPVKAHDLGLWAFASCVATTIANVFQAVESSRHGATLRDAVLALRLVDGVVVVSLAIVCLLLPRRPEVFFRGRPVDRQWTTSVLSRFTWAYPRPLLDLATKNGDLTEKDIPEPDHTLRADHLVASWVKYNFKGSLMSSLTWAYRYRIATSWALCIVRCILGLGPFLTMLRLIRILEQTSRDKSATEELWMLVLYLGLFNLAEQVS